MFEVIRVQEGAVIEVPTTEVIERQINATFDHIQMGVDKVERLERAKTALAHAAQNWSNTSHMAMHYLSKLENCQQHLTTRSVELEASRNANAALNTTIDNAKRVIAEATRENGGCNDGKRDFLEETGLFDEDEIRRIVDEQITVRALVTIESFSVYVDVPGEHWRSEVEDGECDVDDLIDQADIDSAVRDHIHHQDVDWSVETVEEV